MDDDLQMHEDADGNSLLIKLVSKFPILYDKSLDDYKNIIKKKKIWHAIASEIYSKLGVQVSGKLIVV